MKLKKLLAALVAGVMALTMAPIAASAATPVISNVTIGGVSATAFASGTGTSGDPFSSSVSLDYSKVKGTAVRITFSETADSYEIGGDYTTTVQGTYDYYVTDLLETASVIAPSSTKYVWFKAVTGIETTYYRVTVSIGAASSYALTIAGGGATVDGSSNPMVNAVEGDSVALVASATSLSLSAFSKWVFSTPVTVGANKGTEFGTNAYLVFTMPGSAVTATAVYADGKTYNGTAVGTAGKYALTVRGGSNLYGYDQSGSYSAGEEVYLYPATTTGFNYWTFSTPVTYVTGYDQNDAYVRFYMPSSPLTVTANNYNGTTGYSVRVQGGYAVPSNPTPGEIVTIRYNGSGTFTGWWDNQPAGFLANIQDSTTTFVMPYDHVRISSPYDYNWLYNDDYGTYSIAATSTGYGSASASVSYANYGDAVTFTASSTYTGTTGYPYAYTDPYYLLYGTGGYGYSYGYTGYTYAFTGWTFNRSVTYVAGYSATSNPTRIYVYGDTTGTANFRATAVTPVVPTVPTTPSGSGSSSSSNRNSFTSGGATATLNTSSGAVTAGVNTSGTLNSVATSNAVKASISRGYADDVVTVNLPASTTAISKSAMQKLLDASGNKDLRIQIQSTYGTILIPVSSARQIKTTITASSSNINKAVALFYKAYGNTDITAIETAQTGTFGSSATYRISADAIGLGADYGDKVYVAIYNPSTGKFTKKTVTVNSKGEIAFASSSAGVILFSSYPFSK
ncbi:MAG: hypothetical protein LBL80_01310 [Ruminococcus sp.]|jgi:hypothetical protein|nr:hypothetical protein [Ruminococcus sp.]